MDGLVQGRCQSDFRRGNGRTAGVGSLENAGVDDDLIFRRAGFGSETDTQFVVPCDAASETRDRRGNTLITRDDGFDHPVFGWKDLFEERFVVRAHELMSIRRLSSLYEETFSVVSTVRLDRGRPEDLRDHHDPCRRTGLDLLADRWPRWPARQPVVDPRRTALRCCCFTSLRRCRPAADSVASCCPRDGHRYRRRDPVPVEESPDRQTAACGSDPRGLEARPSSPSSNETESGRSPSPGRREEGKVAYEVASQEARC